MVTRRRPDRVRLHRKWPAADFCGGRSWRPAATTDMGRRVAALLVARRPMDIFCPRQRHLESAGDRRNGGAVDSEWWNQSCGIGGRHHLLLRRGQDYEGFGGWERGKNR